MLQYRYVKDEGEINVIIQMNYELVDSELKLKGGKVTDNKENVFFSASSKYAMRKF